MDLKTYDRTTDKQFRGRQVRTLVQLKNGWAEIPAGTLATIIRKRKGFVLETVACPHCGVKVYISHVGPARVDLVEPVQDRRRQCDVEHLREYPGCFEECGLDKCGAKL